MIANVVDHGHASESADHDHDHDDGHGCDCDCDSLLEPENDVHSKKTNKRLDTRATRSRGAIEEEGNEGSNRSTEGGGPGWDQEVTRGTTVEGEGRRANKQEKREPAEPERERREVPRDATGQEE